METNIIQNILQKIKEGKCSIEAYYSYPTGTIYSHHLFEQNVYDEKVIKDPELHEAFKKAFKIATGALNINSDNKTAIKLKVDDIDEPIYLSRYDLRETVSTKIATNRGGLEFIINTH